MSSTSLKNSLSGALLNLGVDLLTVVPDVLDLLEELLEGALLVPHPHLKVVSLFDVGILLHCSQTVLWRRHPENFLVFPQEVAFLARSLSSHGFMPATHQAIARQTKCSTPDLL